MLTDPGSNPLASLKCVELSPSAWAAAFILATNAAELPASQSASRLAMLFPEGMRRPSSACISVRVSPFATANTDCWVARPS